MKKAVITLTAVVAFVAAPFVQSFAGCDGQHIYMCESQFDRDEIQQQVNDNCEEGATIYVHVYQNC